MIPSPKPSSMPVKGGGVGCGGGDGGAGDGEGDGGDAGGEEGGTTGATGAGGFEDRRDAPALVCFRAARTCCRVECGRASRAGADDGELGPWARFPGRAIVPGGRRRPTFSSRAA